MVRLSCWIASMRGEIGGGKMNEEGASAQAPGIAVFPPHGGLETNPEGGAGRCQSPFPNVAPKLARHFALERRHGRRH